MDKSKNLGDYGLLYVFLLSLVVSAWLTMWFVDFLNLDQAWNDNFIYYYSLLSLSLLVFWMVVLYMVFTYLKKINEEARYGKMAQLENDICGKIHYLERSESDPYIFYKLDNIKGELRGKENLFKESSIDSSELKRYLLEVRKYLEKMTKNSDKVVDQIKEVARQERDQLLEKIEKLVLGIESEHVGLNDNVLNIIKQRALLLKEESKECANNLDNKTSDVLKKLTEVCKKLEEMKCDIGTLKQAKFVVEHKYNRVMRITDS